MQSAWLGREKYQFLNHWFDLVSVPTHEIRIFQSPIKEDGRSTQLAIPSGPHTYCDVRLLPHLGTVPTRYPSQSHYADTVTVLS